jgi:hypothetical protein
MNYIFKRLILFGLRGDGLDRRRAVGFAGPGPDRFVSRNTYAGVGVIWGADVAMARPWISRRPRLQGLTEQGTDGARYKAESVYNESAPDIPAELHTVFIFRKVFLHRDAVGARQWWERMEAASIGICAGYNRGNERWA